MESFPISYWHWWILAVMLLILELLVPATFFLWSAIAAVGSGFLVLLIPTLTSEYQLLIFSVASVVSVVASRLYLKKHPLKSEEPFLNQRSAQYIGRTFTLSEAIVNGKGRVEVDDGSWRVEGPDCPVGTQVKVISVNGVYFKVKPVKGDES
jgi:hypothetical protein